MAQFLLNNQQLVSSITVDDSKVGRQHLLVRAFYSSYTIKTGAIFVGQFFFNQPPMRHIAKITDVL
jgi:hypothetical protein